jgi:uncharacterized iron-regulated protein
LAALLLPASAAEPAHALDAYADIAQVGYEDSLRAAPAIGGAVAALGLDLTAFDGLDAPDQAFQ